MEIKDLRAEVTGRPAAELTRARNLLDREISDAGSWGTGPAHVSRWRRQPRRPRVIGAIGVAAAAALAAGLLVAAPGHPPAVSQRTGALTAAYVLNRASAAALSAHQPVPGPGQYIYASVTSVGEVTTDGSSWLSQQTSQLWTSVDGRHKGMTQVVQGDNRKLPWGPVPPPIMGSRVSWTVFPACPTNLTDRSTYDFLATLPTEPGRLHSWIYTHPNGQNPPNEQAWIDIGDMLRELLVPPKLAAALYQVLATIPGVKVVPNVTNATGRRGVALTLGPRYQNFAGANDELILDAQTYQLIGERSVLIKPVKGEGPAGTVLESDVTLRVKVVNQLPAVKDAGVDQCATYRITPGGTVEFLG